MLRLTLVAGSPRIFLTAWSSVRPRTAVSSMRLIRSPLFRPARKAGEPSMGETILTRPSSMPISMPTPTNLPVVPSRNSLNVFLSKNCECGSRPDTMPEIASLISFFSSTGSTYSAFTSPNTAASCCISSSGSGDRLLRALAWSCIVVRAPATAPSATQPATFNLELMKASPLSMWIPSKQLDRWAECSEGACPGGPIYPPVTLQTGAEVMECASVTCRPTGLPGAIGQGCFSGDEVYVLVWFSTAASGPRACRSTAAVPAR